MPRLLKEKVAQFIEFHGFYQEIIKTRFVSLNAVGAVRATGDGYQHDRRHLGLLTKASGDLKAIHFWHLKIYQDDFGRTDSGRVKGRRTVVTPFRVVPP